MRDRIAAKVALAHSTFQVAWSHTASALSKPHTKKFPKQIHAERVPAGALTVTRITVVQ